MHPSHFLAVLREIVDVPLVKVYRRIARDVLALEEPIELYDPVPRHILPTVLREFPKLAEQCAKEGATFEQFLLRLVEQEMMDRESQKTSYGLA
jgi:hypothetical protein